MARTNGACRDQILRASRLLPPHSTWATMCDQKRIRNFKCVLEIMFGHKSSLPISSLVCLNALKNRHIADIMSIR